LAAAEPPLSGRGHGYSVNCVRFSPHGTLLASASTDGTTVLWDVTTRTRLSVLHQPSGCSVRTVAFCRGAAGLLATGGDDNAVVLWNLSAAPESSGSSGPLRTISAHEGTVFALAFSPDGAQLITSDSTGRLLAWAADGGHHELLASVEDAHDLGVTGLDFCPAFTQAALTCRYRLASCGNDGLLKMWCLVAGSVNSLACEKAVVAHANAAMCVSYSAQGHLIVTSGGDKTCRVWSADSLECVGILDGFARYVPSCCFSNDDAFVVATSYKEIKIWKIGDDSRNSCATGRTENTPLAVAVNEKHFRQRLNENRSSKQSFLFKIVPSLSGITACDMHGLMVATATGERDVQLWECTENGYAESMVSPLVGHEGPVCSLRFSSRGLLVSASLSGDIIIWNSTDGSIRKRLENICSLGIRTVQISTQESYICCGGNDDKVHIFHLVSESKEVLAGHENTILAVDFSPEEAWLASGCADGRLVIWHLATEHQRAARSFSRDEAHDLGLTCCAFSPGSDPMSLATGGNDSVINIWALGQNHWAHQRKVTGHAGPVMCLSRSADGRFLASASGDKSARIWDSRSYRCLAVLDQHYKYVSACAFSSPESRLFVTACRNTVSVWKLDIDSQPLAKAFHHTPVSEWSGELRRGATLSP
jgi:WD40 repeat protein